MSRLEEELSLARVEAISVKVKNIELDVAQRIKLVQLLLACSSIRDDKKRVQLVKKLIAENPLEEKSYKQGTSLADIIYLLEFCAQHSYDIDRRLAYELRLLERTDENDSNEWRTFNMFLRTLFLLKDQEYNTEITSPQLDELYELLKKIPWSEHIWMAAYTASMPLDIEILNNEALDNTIIPFGVLSNLAVTRPHKDDFKIAPIIEFVERLIRYANTHILSILATQEDKDAVQAISNWSRRRANEAGMYQQWKKIRAELPFYEYPVINYLLVAFYPLPFEKDIFRIRAWLFDAENKVVGSELPENPRVLKKDIELCLDKIKKQCANYRISADFTVEFFLPTNLLSTYKVENWQTTPVISENFTMRKKVKLSHQHRVVVRSLTRAGDLMVKTKWKEKWQEIDKLQEKKAQSNGYGVVDTKMVKICNENECKDEWKLYQALSKPNIACMVVDFAPKGTSNIFEIAVDAGVPVALWPRELKHTPDDELFPDILAVLLRQLHDLPTATYLQRIKARDKKDRRLQGHFLSLLWDNPHRVPLDIDAGQLTAPLR